MERHARNKTRPQLFSVEAVLAGGPGSPAESNVDSAACAIACSPHGLGLADSFCRVLPK